MIGLQIYTVRDHIGDEQECIKTVSEIKKMGYECVQLAGDIEKIELLAAVCNQTETSVVGILVNMDTCEKYAERIFAVMKLCGASDIGISASAKSEAEAMDIIARANSFAKEAAARGFSFSYHNHSHEFMRTECGKTVMELYAEGFDERYVYFMPDTYWLQHGGIDVRDFISEYGSRVKILHLKDMKRSANGPTFSELGYGNLNLRGIIEEAQRTGIEHYIVEQDICDDQMASAQQSFEYLKAQSLL